MLLVVVFVAILALLAVAGLFAHRRQYLEASYLIIAGVLLLVLFIVFGNRLGT